jgi:hypothetical protein
MLRPGKQLNRYLAFVFSGADPAGSFEVTCERLTKLVEGKNVEDLADAGGVRNYLWTNLCQCCPATMIPNRQVQIGDLLLGRSVLD